MATIDELIVQLDADLKPLETKLKRAEKLLKDFETAANRSLGRVNAGLTERSSGLFTPAQMARLGFSTRPGGPEIVALAA